MDTNPQRNQLLIGNQNKRYYQYINNPKLHFTQMSTLIPTKDPTFQEMHVFG